MRLFRRPWVWLARVRKRRGYGVHSPFAYNFIRGVVNEPWPYYAYEHLSHLHPWLQRHILTYPMHCRRMLFRVANAMQPASFRLIGQLPLERRYITAAVPKAVEVNDGDAALVMVNADNIAQAPRLASAMPPEGAMIIEGIHRNRGNRNLWRALQADSHTGITFDLYDYGILLFDHSRTKQHYIVNF